MAIFRRLETLRLPEIFDLYTIPFKPDSEEGSAYANLWFYKELADCISLKCPDSSRNHRVTDEGKCPAPFCTPEIAKVFRNELQSLFSCRDPPAEQADSLNSTALDHDNSEQQQAAVSVTAAGVEAPGLA